MGPPTHLLQQIPTEYLAPPNPLKFCYRPSRAVLPSGKISLQTELPPERTGGGGGFPPAHPPTIPLILLRPRWIGPLSYYAKLGLDTAAIESKCKDTLWHEVLGITYRVEIVGTGVDCGLVEEEQQEYASISAKPARAAPSQAGPKHEMQTRAARGDHM